MDGSLQINVAQLLKDSIGANRAFQTRASLQIGADAAEVELRAELTRIDGGVLVKAAVATDLPVACVRCLEDFPCHLEFQMQEEYYQTVQIDEFMPLTPPYPPDSFRIDVSHNLDMVEAVRQHALLAVPMQPLCRPECGGICPQCGRLLAGGDCGCDAPRVDPRLAPLLQLKLDDETEG